MNIDRLIDAVRDFAAGDKITFTGSKRKDKSNWGIGIYGPNKREKLISLGTPDKKVAKEIESEVRARLHQSALTGIIPCKTQKAFDDWMAVKEKEVSLNSFKRYRAVLDKALPFLPDEIHRVTPVHIQQYSDWLVRENYKPRSIILELSTLAQVFDKARRLGYTNTNPVDDIRKPRKPATAVVPYTEAELQSIFDELDGAGGFGRCLALVRVLEAPGCVAGYRRVE